MSARENRTSYQTESSRVRPRRTPFNRGKSALRYWNVRRSRRSVTTSNARNLVAPGRRMSISPDPVSCETAPGTLASAKAMSARSMRNVFTGPPDARSVPVMFPCQSYGNARPLKWRSRSKFTGSSDRATSLIPSTGPPTANVIVPRRCDRLLRTSSPVSAYSITRRFPRWLWIATFTRPPPVGGITSLIHAKSASPAVSLSVVMSHRIGSPFPHQIFPRPRATVCGSSKWSRSIHTESSFFRTTPLALRTMNGGSCSTMSTLRSVNRSPAESGSASRVRPSAPFIAVHRIVRMYPSLSGRTSPCLSASATRIALSRRAPLSESSGCHRCTTITVPSRIVAVSIAT